MLVNKTWTNSKDKRGDWYFLRSIEPAELDVLNLKSKLKQTVQLGISQAGRTTENEDRH